MKERIARILLMSDSHCMVIPHWKQKGQTEKGAVGWIVEFFISIWKLFNFRFFKKALKKAGSMGRFDKVIYCGDLAECVWNERGMITTNDIHAIERFKALIELGIDVRVNDIHYIPGDHELGYILPLSCDPKGGISWRSINNFESLFGPLFSGFSIEDFHFLLLSSSLIIQSVEHLSERERKFIIRLRDNQYNFIRNYFACRKELGTVFLFLHDPDVLEAFHAQVLKYKVLCGGATLKAFCGHMHTEASLEKYQNLGHIARAISTKEKILRWLFNRNEKGKKVMQWAKDNLRRIELFKKYNLQIVPSTAGMMGRGGGFLILNLYSDGSYEIKKHKI